MPDQVQKDSEGVSDALNRLGLIEQTGIATIAPAQMSIVGKFKEESGKILMLQADGTYKPIGGDGMKAPEKILKHSVGLVQDSYTTIFEVNKAIGVNSLDISTVPSSSFPSCYRITIDGNAIETGRMSAYGNTIGGDSKSNLSLTNFNVKESLKVEGMSLSANLNNTSLYDVRLMYSEL